METSNTLRSGLLSVVLPAYNEEESVPLAADTIGDLLTGAGIDHELVFVNDGSRDHTWQAIQEAARRRLYEETGLRSELTELFTFIYRAEFDNGLSEYELDHVLVGNYDSEIRDWLPDPDEIAELSWMDMDHLIAALSQRPQKFASWFLIAAPQVLAYMQRLIQREKAKPVKVEESR